MNERIRAFLGTFYAASYPSGVTNEWGTLLQKYLREEQTGDYNTRWAALIALV